MAQLAPSAAAAAPADAVLELRCTTAASAVLSVASLACRRLEAAEHPHHRGRALQSCALQTQVTYGSREWVWVWGLGSVLVQFGGFVSDVWELFRHSLGCARGSNQVQLL